MEIVKTHFHLSKSLLDQVEAVAREMKISRSRLVTMALEDFLRRYQNRRLLEQINQAYEDGPDPEDQELLSHMRRVQRELLEDE